MTQLDEAISRYHRILESEPYRDLRWVKNLQDEMEARQLSAGGRLLCPFLRPNFVTQKQYDNLVKTGEALISAVDRMLRTALTSPQLLSRMQLFPRRKNAGRDRSRRRDVRGIRPTRSADPERVPACHAV